MPEFYDGLYAGINYIDNQEIPYQLREFFIGKRTAIDTVSFYTD